MLPLSPDLEQRRQFRVLFEDGRRLTLWAEDSCDALAQAQRLGSPCTITG
jgi:hypothetical protein